MKTIHGSTRRNRRGTLLVVVLGLLVALFVIGTSFSYVTLSERRAAANYLDRQRALDLALDGVEYSIARLRSEATQKPFDRIELSTAGTKDKEYDSVPYALRPLDGLDPSVSWPKSRSRTATGNDTVDGNWVDVDGDGGRGSTETAWGTNLISANVSAQAGGFASTVTQFQGDGLSVNQIAPRDVPRGELKYGAAGTYSQLGNYFRVRAIDAASLLNLNNYKGEGMRSILTVLGNAIADWVTQGNPKPEYNPFPKEIVNEIVKLRESQIILVSKDQLRPLYQNSAVTNGEQLFNLASMFVTVQSYVDRSYRDWTDVNSVVQKEKGGKNNNPRKLPEVRLWREGFTDSSTTGRDGWPNWIPDQASTFGKAPVNINTATKPVLVCLFANLEAVSRMLYYRQQDKVTGEDKLYKDKFGATIRRQNSGTTDLGRQNNHTTGPGKENEGLWYPSGDDNRAVFQLVPIGPLTTKYGTGPRDTGTGGGGEDYALALADAVINMRKQEPFHSWQDFDARFCQGLLLGMPADRGRVKFPDVVGAGRGTLTGTNVENMIPRGLLPPADNCHHPANPLRSTDAAMNEGAFRAWYWKSTVDMIRAALNPNNVSARWNPDYPYYQNVDRMDLVVANSPICFSSMGIYEVTSQGEMLAKPKGFDDKTTAAFDVSQMVPVARRQVRTVVKIYEIMRHTTQKDFNTPVDPELVRVQTATSSGQRPVETMVAHAVNDTKTFPHSIDELSNGSWRSQEADIWKDTQDAHDDARNLSYKKGDQGKNRIKGHNDYTASSSDFGYVAMNPRDRTPFTETMAPRVPLNFWVRFNEGLRGRSTTAGRLSIYGVNSDNAGLATQWGHFPWEKGAIFDDFISTATPRSTEPALVDAKTSEFERSAEGRDTTDYGTLRPDGVFMSGLDLRQRATHSDSSLGATFGRRGSERGVRLKVLRYPCGSQEADNPFCPIRDAFGRNFRDGIDDSRQAGYAGPTTVDIDKLRVRLGCTPQSPAFRGTDEHNVLMQPIRKYSSNMPYYEGTVDFWIKWDLPPQGSDSSGASQGGGNRNQIVSMGEIDPGSMNYSGLFGATAYGRFKESRLYIDPDSGSQRTDKADFEGVQFFVYKEAGGVLRFTRLYFSEALGQAVGTGDTSSVPVNPVPFGYYMRRILDLPNPANPSYAASPLGGYTGTNDICNDADKAAHTNDGFLYSRTDAWINLYEATANGVDGTKQLILRVHDWHRFTLSYNSNTETPYRLWIDGREVGPRMFFPDPTSNQGFRNDGRHKNPAGVVEDAEIPKTSATAAEYIFLRTTTKLLEINPEDRLTIGCIFRRQVDNSRDQGEYDKWFGEVADDPGTNLTPTRPVFKFDSNFVAVANATIDDFRISQSLVAGPPALTDLRTNSRYAGKGDKESYFEGGFLPMQTDDRGEERVYALPMRLGSLRWTEIRPDWDPYAQKGLRPEDSCRLEVRWGIVDDISDPGTAPTGGEKRDVLSLTASGTSGDRTSADMSSDQYWASGGLSLKGAVLPSGIRVGMLVYQVVFRVGDKIEVNNVTAILDDISVTVLAPPRKLSFVVDY